MLIDWIFLEIKTTCATGMFTWLFALEGAKLLFPSSIVAIRITEMVFFRSALSKYVAFVCAKLVKAMNFVDI